MTTVAPAPPPKAAPRIAGDLQGLAQPITTLTPLEGNPRVGDVAAVAASLRRFGQRKPIVARASDRQVTAGNHTLQAAISLGWDEIAVVLIDDDEATAKAYALADNRTAELGGYHDANLAAMIHDVAQADAELLADTGWSGEAVDRLLDEIAAAEADDLPPMGGDLDDVPESAPAVTKRGDVWLLGPHRVMCGDSTDAADVDTLMDGGRADMVWTDPPYGIAYQAMRGGEAIAGDADPTSALAVTKGALALCASVPVHFVCCDWRSLPTIHDAMVSESVMPKACIVWDKKVRVQNLDRFAKRHEMILYAGPYGGQPTVDTDVWEVARDFDPDHPTPKPVELVAKGVAYGSQPGDIVLDLFGGSGSTLIAAHQLGRHARLMELSPTYVDVICRRYQEATGDRPVFAATGAPHDFTDT